MLAPVDREVVVPGLTEPRVPLGHPVEAEIDAERIGWHGQPWSLILNQAQTSRSRMLEVWYALPTRTDAASWWVGKAGAEHYAEHLDRLGDWVYLLHERRYDVLPLPTRAEWQE